jgi:hypothetical protein
MSRRPIVLALMAAAASGVAYALLRLRRGGTRDRPRAREPQEYTCDCGQAFRMTGMGRHRVFWLANAPEGDPLLSDRCPSCDRPLPREPEVRVVAGANGA